MSTHNEEVRSDDEIMNDWIDPLLTDVYLEADLVTASKDATFTRDEVYDLMRLAGEDILFKMITDSEAVREQLKANWPSVEKTLARISQE